MTVILPVRTEENGCKGSKGHFSLPDSTVLDSSWNTPSWEMKRKITSLFQKCKSDSWTCVKISPAEIYSLITTLPLCGQWFQRKHSSGGRLLSHRHRHVFDCSCGRPWQSLHTPTGTSTVRKRASMNHIYSVIEQVYCTYCSDFL